MTSLHALPQGPGLFQVKVTKGLLIYPQGKSAMFYYGFAESLSGGVRIFRDNVLPLLEAEGEALVIRWMATADFAERFKKHLDTFVEKFGSLPLGNQRHLEKQSRRFE